MQINSAKDLTVYTRAYELAMRVFELSKRFPAEERFALTGRYITGEQHDELTSLCQEIGKMLGSRSRLPAPF